MQLLEHRQRVCYRNKRKLSRATSPWRARFSAAYNCAMYASTALMRAGWPVFSLLRDGVSTIKYKARLKSTGLLFLSHRVFCSWFVSWELALSSDFDFACLYCRTARLTYRSEGH